MMIRLLQLGFLRRLISLAAPLLLLAFTIAAPSGQAVAQEQAKDVRRTTGLRCRVLSA
jgi:hypothetical protein